MQYSIPSDVTVIEKEGLASQIYVGDMGGQLWRFDIPNTDKTGADLVDGGVIARLSGTTPDCLLYTSPSPRDGLLSRMPSSA